MTSILPFGLGKVQRMPYDLWKELREVSSQSELVRFVQANEPTLRGFVANRLSDSKAAAIFRGGRIEKRQEAYYLTEVLKSAILRGGGSSIMGWALWSANGVSETKFERLPREEAALDIAGMHVNVPVSYAIKIDKSVMSGLEAATLTLHRALSAGKCKILTRADYILERDSAGGIVPCLVDVGESNLSFALTEALFGAFPKFVPNITHVVGLYIEAALKAYGRTLKSAAVIAEDETMLTNMPYEFAALSIALAQRTQSGSSTSPVQVTHLGALARTDSFNSDFVLRCFRSKTAAETFKEFLTRRGNAVPFVVDSLEFVSAYDKSRVRKTVEQNKPMIAGSVKIPLSEVFELEEGGLEAATEQIFGSFSGKGIGDIVIKPAAKPLGASSIAFFYNVGNSYHLEQASYSIQKLYRKGVRSIIVEEAVGNGVAGDRKAEIRVFALGLN